MDTVAAAAPPAQCSALSAQATPKRNTASQPAPQNIAITMQNSLEGVIASTPKDIGTAAQNSIEKATAASPQAATRSTKFVALKSLEEALTLGNHIQKSMELKSTNESPSQANRLIQPMLSQPINIQAAAQDSFNITLAQNSIKRTKYPQTVPTTHQPVNTIIVTPQGSWQNMAVPVPQPQQTLPAVQDFLKMAFETVQRSRQTVVEAAKNSLQTTTNQPASAVQHPPTSIAPPLSPQTDLPAPFQSQPQSVQNSSKPRSASLPNNAYEKVSSGKSTETSASLDQTPSTSEITKAPINQTGATFKSQSYPGYTFYNTSRHNPKQVLSSPKRTVLVAKRQNPANTETGNSVDNSTIETLVVQVTQQDQNSNTSQKKNTGAKDSPETHDSSRVAQTYREFKERSANGTHSAHSLKGTQNAQNTNSNRNWRRLKTNDDNVQEIDPKRRVLVSGFPAYTQSQDLTRVLTRFGRCQVDSCRNRLAVVTFDSEAEAKSAIMATDDINIYGEFLEIKPYTNPRHVDELYRAYKKVISTQKCDDITMPNKIDLSGDFYQQLDNIQNVIRLTQEQVQAVTNLYVDLEMVLRKEWPGCVAIPFGSIPTGLGIKSSDADCYVELPAAVAQRARGAGFVPRARRLLARYPAVFTHLVAIPRANTPIVKFRHVPSGFHCDVSAKTPLGAQNSKLIKLLIEHDPRLAPVAVLLKYWAKVHELSGTGRLTNYALTMMVIFYLQQPAVALVPPVERLQRDAATRYIVDHWNAGFSTRNLPGPPNSIAIPDLLGGFFEFYASFDFEKLIVCPYLGTAVLKSAFEAPHTLPLEFARYVGNVRDNLAGPLRHATPFCVQDPFEQSHNVASAVCVKLAAEIMAYLKFAADAYAADRVNGCRNFLRTILLTRPKLRVERVTPSTNIALIPRVRGYITDPDWRGTLREIILEIIFEKMLKLSLKRDEKEGKKERSRRQFKVDRERYSGSASKPVWRRKKVHNHVAPNETPEQFVTRQVAVTEEILGGATATPLQFEIELWFRDEPRNCSLGFKMLDGHIDAFRQFVMFLHTTMLDWFRILLKPYLAPLKEDANQALLADAAERAAAKIECSIKYEREPPRPPSPPQLVTDQTAIIRDLNAVTLDSEEQPHSTSVQKTSST